MNIPVTGGAAVLEPVGGDVASRLRKIGMALSTSGLESLHLAAAEGTMSRATGVVLPWHGAMRCTARRGRWRESPGARSGSSPRRIRRVGAAPADGAGAGRAP